MITARIGTFFKLHLTTEKTSVRNSLTNLAFAPLQHLIGQKNFQSLNGRVYELPPVSSKPSDSLLKTAAKVIVYIVAFIAALPLTPLGALTRWLSLYSKEMRMIYLTAMTLPIKDSLQRSQLLKSSPELYQEVERCVKVIHNQRLMDQQLQLARASLDRIKNGSQESEYPFPFDLAERLNSNPQLRQVPLPQQVQAFEEACHSITHQANELERKSTFAKQYLNHKAGISDRFFAQLKNKLEDFDLGTSNIVSYLQEQDSYPFSTFALLKDHLSLFSENGSLPNYLNNYSACVKYMQATATLTPFLQENPPADDYVLNDIKKAIGELNTIARLTELYSSALKV